MRAVLLGSYSTAITFASSEFVLLKSIILYLLLCPPPLNLEVTLPWLFLPPDFFIGANLTVYYTHEQLQFWWFLGPDLFLVRGVDPRPRTSWVDRLEKKRLYQTMFRTPEYFWFSPITGEFAGFRLISR